MVVPKGAPIKKTHVLDNRKDDVTSLKPEPFREPPGMMTIDLNKTKLRQKSQIKYVTRLLIVLCTALVLSLLLAAGLTLFEQRVHLFTVLPPHQEISQQTKLKDALLLSNVLENMDIQLCRKLQTPESCCEFTKNTQTAKILSELCTVNNMLKILEEFEERARFKRQVGPYPEQWGFNPNDERVNILFEHNDPLPPYFQRNFFPFSQEEMLGNAPFLESPQKKPLVSKFSDVKIIKGDTSAVNENFLTNYEHDRVSGLNIAPPVKITKNPADLELSTTVLPAEMRLAIIPTEVIPEIISTQSEAQRSYLKEDFLPFTQKDMLVNDPFVESPQKKPLVSKFSDVKVIKEDTSAVNENVPNNGDKDRIPGISIAPPVIITKNPADLEPSTTVLPVEMRLTITPTQVNQEISFTRTELQRPNFERDFFPFSQEEMPGNDPFLGSPEKKSLAAKFGNSKIIKKNSTSSKYSYSELKGSEDTAGLKIVPTVNISSKPEDLNLTTSALPLENRIVTVPSKVITEENKPSELFNSQVNDDEYEFKISSDTKQNDISTAPLVQSFFTMKLPEHTKQDILEHITLAPQELVVSEMSASENTLFVGSPQKKPLVSKFGDVVVVRGKNSSSKDNPTKLDAGEDSDIIHINIIPPMKISKKSGNPKPAAGTPIAISSTEKISENDLISTDTLPTTLRNNLITEETSINRKKRQYNLREDFLPKIPFFPSSNHFGNSQDSSLMQHFPEKPISKPTEQDLISAQDRNAFPEQFSFQNPPIPQMKPLVSKFTDTEVTKENNDKFSKLSRNEDVAAMKIVPPTKITTQLDKLPEKYGSGANHEVSGFPQKKPSVSKFGDRVEIQENNPSKDAQSIDFRTSGDESEFKTASNDKIAKKSDDFMPREDFEDLPPVITEHILGDSDKFPLVAHFENSMQDVPKSKSMNSHPEISKIIDLKGDPSRATNDLLEKSKQQRPIEDFAQSNQLIFSNPCFNSPKDPGLLKVVSMSQARAQSQPPLFVLNPSLFYNMPPTGTSGSYFPNLYYPPMPPMPQTIQSITANPPVQVTAPGGQFLLCNPIPTPLNSAAGVPQVEVRRNTGNLQDLFLDMNNGFSYRRGNESRAASLFCSVGEFECLDNSRCIKKYQVCDNEVHCDDSSDEAACTCKERVGKLRHCDGYCDCPRCEDEDGCFGCSEGEFSCDDWSRFRRATCIPLEQRCDGVKQCEITGKDETDCAILADHLGNFPINKVSNSVGFLHRNYKGKWYPTCFGTELWAAEVCEIEAGPSSITPKAHMTLTTNPYRGSFINILPNNEVTLVNTCVQDRAAFVECPPIYCGLRFIINNPYRDSEVDTSMEEMLNDLERAYEIRGEVPQEMILGQSRVVGGKPSQPSAWPWLVSIFKNGYFHCAGVLINDQWVITAAHCIDRHWQNYYEIQAGTLRRFSYAPMDQRRWVTAVVPHEQYEKANLRNDIGKKN
ncbi:hypothetical protein ABEB36_006721 [Hypothenemus hampei]|uniref:Peptidase S1 domain-containing protein n=1 Tax=Hypothenemus hampei TaxID=57062 RepID=A0ABD1ERI7_HYPHA